MADSSQFDEMLHEWAARLDEASRIVATASAEGRALTNLRVTGANVDLALIRHEHDVSVNVLQRRGNVEIVVVM